MATAYCYSVADTKLNEAADTTNYGSDTTISIDGSAGVRERPVIKFDLSTIPGGASINSVTLYVFNQSTLALTNTVPVYRVLVNWIEAQATWAVRTTGVAWTSVGCSGSGTDRAADAMGSLTIPNVADWYNCALDVAQFRLMQASNNGVVLYSDAPTKVIRSREFGTPGYVPYLAVVYVLQPGNPTTYLSDYGVL